MPAPAPGLRPAVSAGAVAVLLGLEAWFGGGVDHADMGGQVSALRNRMTPFREERARRYQLKAPRRISPQIPNEKLRARCGSPGSS